jgi:Na+/H+ antiporter NhaD/arsenite permease-like protein
MQPSPPEPRCLHWIWGGGALAAGLLPAPALAASVVAPPPGLVWGIPFLGIILSLGLFPIAAPRLWYRRLGLVAAFWTLALLIPQAALIGPGAALAGAWRAVLLDYLPFVTLLAAMFTVGGGILVRGGPWGTPGGNTALLALGTLLAGVVGPIAASMVLIHPLLRANAHRTRKVHLVVFFIILVANAGGVVTPMGNPPLYIGLLQGVPYGWPLRHLAMMLLALAVPLLAGFWLLDRRRAAGEPPPPPRRALRLRGGVNLALLGLVIATVLAESLWRPGGVALFGVTIGIERLTGMAVLIAVIAISAAVTPLAVHEGNMFSWAPIIEVAKLFAAIFVTITPALAMLQAGDHGPLAPLLRLTVDTQGQPNPIAYFWLAGMLSAFLDNAPTYLVFFQIAGNDPVRLTGALSSTLAAMSTGSVMFGALTYIGNAPNMLVRSVAAHRGVRMPGFFGYMAVACALLLPLFAMLTLLFFR